MPTHNASGIDCVALLLDLDFQVHCRRGFPLPRTLTLALKTLFETHTDIV